MNINETWNVNSTKVKFAITDKVLLSLGLTHYEKPVVTVCVTTNDSREMIEASDTPNFHKFIERAPQHIKDLFNKDKSV